MTTTVTITPRRPLELKPCPWCPPNHPEQQPTLVAESFRPGYRVRCWYCEAEGPRGLTKEEAAAEWDKPLARRGEEVAP